MTATAYYQCLGDLGGGDIFAFLLPRHTLYACTGCGTVCTVPAMHARLCEHQAGTFTHQPDACAHPGWIWLVEVTATGDGSYEASEKQWRCVGCGLPHGELAGTAKDTAPKGQVP